MTHYLGNAQCQEIAHRATSWLWRSEAPTWLLIVAVYVRWFGLALHARQLGWPLSAALLTLASTWYTSLQHELLHGHPTRSARVNALFGIAPLAEVAAGDLRELPMWGVHLGLLALLLVWLEHVCGIGPWHFWPMSPIRRCRSGDTLVS